MDQSGSRGCGLGIQWNEEEAGWTAVWVRRGSSNMFDVTQTKDSAKDYWHPIPSLLVVIEYT